MAKPKSVRDILGSIVACAVFGVGGFFLVYWLLGVTLGTTELGPVAFKDEILKEPDPFVADIKAAAQAVRERWSYVEHRKAISSVDVDVLEREAIGMLGDEPDEAKFRRAITRFVAGLCDGHAGVIFKAKGAPTYRWPFTLVEVKEGVMIDGVLHKLTAVERGEMLIAVDGQPIEEWIREAKRFIGTSSVEGRRRRALEDGARFVETPRQKFRVRGRDGKEREVELDCPKSMQPIPTPARPRPKRKHEMLEGNIGYFRPGTFSSPANSGFAKATPEQRHDILQSTYAEFDRIIGELQGAKALVVDLRSNPGGTDLLGQFLVDRLVEPGYTYYQLQSLTTQGWRSFSSHGSIAPAGKNSLRVPVAVLTDTYTFSTADNVACCLQDVHPNVTIVGRPNGAGSGAPRRFVLPRTRTQISFCTQRVKSPNGRMIEGVPLTPGVEVRWTKAGVLAGKDEDLEAALKVLRK